MSYDITTNVGKVRLNIGDTDTTNEVFSDDEIGIFLTRESNNINLSSADALDSWAAKYSTNPSTESIGGYSYSQTIIFRLMQLSKRFRDTEEEANNAPVFDWAEPDFTGGSGITEESD